LTASHVFESIGGEVERIESLNGFTIQPVMGVLNVRAAAAAAMACHARPAGVRRDVLGVG
jgi:hypothetical protein